MCPFELYAYNALDQLIRGEFAVATALRFCRGIGRGGLKILQTVERLAAAFGFADFYRRKYGRPSRGRQARPS